jgi:NAD-dependent SIR2 family protein deacetylase
MTKKAKTIETKVCTKCGETKPTTDFRIHKSGFHLNQCRECERAANRARTAARKAAKGSPAPTTFSVTTKSGKEYQVSSVAILGGRKVVSTASDKVIFTAPEVSRDEARAIYAAYAGVPNTGISATKVVE